MRMHTLGLLLSRRWRWMTLTALTTCLVLIGLGAWQLHRLGERRALNAQLAARLFAEPVPLTAASLPTTLTALRDLEYRRVVAQGTFDYAHEVALSNQVLDGQLGLHLMTPLVLDGSDHAIMVDRGWIPASAADPAGWTRFQEGQEGQEQTSTLTTTVSGWLRLPPDREAVTRALPGAHSSLDAGPLIATFDVSALEKNVGRPLLPAVIIEAPHAGDRSAAPQSSGAAAATDAERLPIRRVPLASIGDGVHLIAATQWFVIAGIVLVGLVGYVRRHEGLAEPNVVPPAMPDDSPARQRPAPRQAPL